MNFIDYERSNNKLLRTLETDHVLQPIVNRLTGEELALLVPQNIVLDDVDISPEFVATHAIRFTTQPRFETLNGLKGTFSDSLDAIVLDDLPDSHLHPRIHVLRHTDYYLNNIAKLNIFVISDAIRLKWTQAAQGQPPVGASPTLSDGALSPDGRSPSLQSLASVRSAAPRAKPGTTFSFQDYVDKMRNKKATTIVKPIKHFIETVNAGTEISPDALPDRVRQFLQVIMSNIAAHPLWKDASPQELETAAEGTEKYIMTKIYARAFSPLVEDVQKDQRLHRRLSVFSGIDCSALDIDPAVPRHPGWVDAIQEIRKINHPRYKTPRDKLICLINSCKIIFNVLSSIAPDKVHGADDFLPCLILLVVKANPPHLHSNLKYISDFRNPTHMASEAGYYFTAIQSVMYWWENIDERSLRIPVEEFHRLMSSVDSVATVPEYPPEFPTTELGRVTPPLPGNASGDDLFSEPPTRTVVVDVEPPIAALTKVRLDQLMEQRFGGAPPGEPPRAAPPPYGSPPRSADGVRPGSVNSNATLLDYDPQQLRVTPQHEELAEEEEPPLARSAADTLGPHLEPPPPTPAARWGPDPTGQARPASFLSDGLDRAMMVQPEDTGSSDFVAQLARYVTAYHAASHDPNATRVEFAELRVADLQQLVHRYNTLLAFERAVLQACRKAHLLPR